MKITSKIYQHQMLKSKWGLLFIILAMELQLAYSIPENILTNLPVLGILVNLLQHVAPVLGKVTHETAKHPEAVRFYIFLTMSLMPIKVWIFYSWLNSDRMGIYRYLVISPLTDQQPAGGDNFITDPLRQEKKQAPKQKSRSLFSRLFWSTLILVITLGGCWVILEFYSSPDAPSYEGGDAFRDLVSEGYKMWLTWSLKLLTFTSFLLAVSISILRDYGLFIKRFFNKLRRIT